ncbi:MAG: PP2C family protein-serine/threonine phosphatase, partial [Phycisphaerales bacterium]
LGKITELNKGGMVLGVEPDSEYETDTVQLESNDVLLFCTDGLTDAINYDGDIWGRERMLAAATVYSCESADLMVKNILAYRRRFVGLARQVDDTSMIVVKVNKSPKKTD